MRMRAWLLPRLCLVCLPWLIGLGACKADRDGEEGDPSLSMNTTCAADSACGAGRRCEAGVCVADLGPCGTDDDCINDSYCACPPDVSGAQCRCVPWGKKPRGSSDPACAGQAFAPGAFKAPVLKCQ